ncbi:MAG: iron dependent repressor, metal binding and dimerization domain protein [Saprospiraceae bacterium]
MLPKSYQPLRLSEKGMKAASLIVRKHRLTEMFLIEKMGFGWESVHEIAEEKEHIREVKSIEPFDGSLVVEYAGNKGETLSRMACERILVE